MQRLQLLIFVDSISGLWDFWVYMFRRISFLIENTCFNSTIRINMFTEWRLVPSTKMLLWCNGYLYIHIILYINTFSTSHIFPWNPLQASFDKSLPNWPKKNNKHIIPSTSKESPPPPQKKKAKQKRISSTSCPPSNKRATNDFVLVQQKKLRETLSCT